MYGKRDTGDIRDGNEEHKGDVGITEHRQPALAEKDHIVGARTRGATEEAKR